jgi:PAS domain S-box-containing protein
LTETLRQSEERLRRAIQLDAVGVVFFADDGRITEVNDAFLRMTGYSRQTLTENPLGWHELTPPEWRSQSRQATAGLEANGRAQPLECEFTRRDGTRGWALFSATRIKTDENVGFIVDLTETKVSESELKRIRENLEMVVQERTAELDAVNGSLRDEIIEQQRTEIARQELLGQLVNAQEDERRRISRELHDEVGQHVAALMLGLKALETTASPPVQATLHQLQMLTERMGQEVHELALNLRPTALDDLGLLRTLSNYVEDWSSRTRIEVDFHSSGWRGERLPPHIETTIYRIVQEALTNVIKHAQANRVSLIIERRDDQAVVIIEDNGVGFEQDASSFQREKRLGLLGMKERAALVEGELNVESSRGRGTTVFLRIRLPATTGNKAT